MGCRHYFVVDRFEELVDEGDSRSSSRAHEHEHFRLVSQLHVAIQILWSQCPPRWTVWTNRLVVQSQRVSPFYHDPATTFLSLCLSLSKRSANKVVFLQSREKRVSISWAFERDVCSVTKGLTVLPWLVGLVGWLLLVEQLLNPIPSSNHVSRKSLEEDEVTHIRSRTWLLQFPSEQLSGYTKLGVYCKEW